MFEKQICRALFSRIRAGGLTVTYWDGQSERFGPESWLHVRLLCERTVWAICRNVHLGFGEAYMNGEIAIDGDLAELGHLTAANREVHRWARKLQRRARETHAGKRGQAANVRHHYDLGNDFYRLWLDRSMTYSCAYFRGPGDSLEQAQQQKVGHILRKLNLAPGMTLLDIGSGWGELVCTAAREHGVRAHGITLSREQLAQTRARIAAEGLADLASVELATTPTYRASRASIVWSQSGCMSMSAHATTAPTWPLSTARCALAGSRCCTRSPSAPIAPRTHGSTATYSPAVACRRCRASSALLPERDFRAVNYESLRRHYARTLDEWWQRFESARERVQEMYGERFVRMWRLYLRGAFAAFTYGELDLAQILWTKGPSDEIPMTREYMYPRRRPDREPLAEYSFAVPSAQSLRLTLRLDQLPTPESSRRPGPALEPARAG